MTEHRRRTDLDPNLKVLFTLIFDAAMARSVKMEIEQEEWIVLDRIMSWATEGIKLLEEKEH